MLRGARPISSSKIIQHYRDFVSSPVDLSHYQATWRQWLTTSSHKVLRGLEHFTHADFVNGTSQCFDHFWLRHHDKRPVTFRGEFQYHACVNKSRGHFLASDPDDLACGDALVISLPFSDTGAAHVDLESILVACHNKEIPVCLDLAYWGISKNISIDLDRYPCIQQVTCSLSKSFWVLENHRVGVRFSRYYQDDGISMMNETNMQNHHSMSLGVDFMVRFSCDWNWHTYGSRYEMLCQQMELDPTDVVIFAVSQDPKYQEFSRGRPGHYRLCLSNFLSEDI